MADENNNAYLGYRSAGRRPESQQDRRSAADAPLSALRGFASGVLGAPGDLEALIRMLPGLNERTVLPTSADVEKRLPMPELNRTPTGRAFTGAGQLGGGFYAGPGSPLKVIAESPQIIGRAARDFAQSVSPVNVIKPKGGNWLAGSVERAVQPMKRPMNPNEVEGVEAHLRKIEPFYDLSNPREARELAGMRQHVTALKTEETMHRWLDQKLGKYIRNEMATPEDPLRALAERNISHMPVEELAAGNEWIPESLAVARMNAGYPPHGVGESAVAKGWESAADSYLNVAPASEHVKPLSASEIRQGYMSNVDSNPWLLKVPPETPVYYPQVGKVGDHDMGFPHLADELRNAINPESGLPAALQWKYADLDKVTVPQAVQRVHDINEWRAAQKAEADMARAMNPATFTHKEYPEQGMRWVELRAPEADVSDIRFEKTSQGVRAFDAEGNRLTSPGGYNVFANEDQALMQLRGERASKPLADALKYEGETMGHCVGGYCPDVVEGRSKIYSLRDKKGQPHVTIEVRPGRKLTEKDLPDDVRELLSEQYADASREEFEAAVQQYVKQQAVPDEIVQIKGKGNKAPKEDYLPAVQDFVRSGQWGRVGDLGNTGLRRVEDTSGVRYLTEQEFKDALENSPKPDLSGYATGGAVETAASGVGEYNPAKIQSLVDSLREEMYG